MFGKMTGRIMLSMACCVVVASACSPAVGAKKRPVYPLPPSKRQCINCHLVGDGNTLGPLRDHLSALCLNCHPDRIAPREHAVDVVPKQSVNDLPLFEGKITCATCHDPHVNLLGTMLRKEGTQLCLSCHPY